MTSRPDHLALYRPGTGVIVSMKNSGDTFISRYGGIGLGQYDLKSAIDHVIAFDFEYSGRQVVTTRETGDMIGPKQQA